MIIGIEHAASTSVPGLAAKPIVVVVWAPHVRRCREDLHLHAWPPPDQLGGGR
ncbi:hypothetical protein ACQP2X_25375 [Actinoplanes sp. CA-131856]